MGIGPIGNAIGDKMQSNAANKAHRQVRINGFFIFSPPLKRMGCCRTTPRHRIIQFKKANTLNACSKMTASKTGATYLIIKTYSRLWRNFFPSSPISISSSTPLGL